MQNLITIMCNRAISSHYSGGNWRKDRGIEFFAALKIEDETPAVQALAN